MIVYCDNLDCEYNDENECGQIYISIDDNGECMSFCMKEQAEAYYKAADTISCMKSADVKPVVRAEWRTGTGIFKFACSNCSAACLNKTNFCPHCGADMRRGEE